MRNGGAIGAIQTLVARAALHYPSFPWACVDTNGIPHIGYRDGDGVAAVDHSTGGCAWYIRNFGAAQLLFTSATEGGQVQAFAPFQLPNSNKLAFILRLYPGAVGNFNRYVISPDLGLTIGATAALPVVPGLDATGAIEFCDFKLAPDGQSVYCFVYNDTAGHDQVALLSTTLKDFPNWTVRSFLRTVAVGAPRFNEVGGCMFPDGRWLAWLRNDINLANAGTMYSDDDGLTWSAPVVYANVLNGDNFQLGSPGKGFAINERYALVTGRLNANGGVSDDAVSTACWILDRDGKHVAGPAPFILGGNASHGGYTAIIDVPGIGLLLVFHSDLNINDGLGFAPGLHMANLFVRGIL